MISFVSHAYFDLSWDEVAKYIVSSMAIAKVADMINIRNRFRLVLMKLVLTDQ
ncbi:MAG: hypothetical protein IPG02_02795 [Ignavibacteria bacterium]|nr:hypothetical protein [Ignavibacteria bacterium]